MLPPGRVLVIGGTTGIGADTARRLTTAGVEVAIANRVPARRSAICAELGCRGYTMDATDPAQVEALFDELSRENAAPITGVVHAIGSIVIKPAHLTSPEEFNATLTQNLSSAFYVLRSAVRLMSAGGSIVLFSSAAARIGLAQHEAIAAAKAGIIGLTLSAAATYASKNIRINCIAPGLVRTPLAERITSNPAAEKASIAMHPLKRLGEPGEVAALAAMLVTSDGSWITGQVFGVDGGLSTVRT